MERNGNYCQEDVADLAYTILATFDSLTYHLYNIKYKDYTFDCFGCTEGDENAIDATITKLSILGLETNDELEMEYDYGSTTTFKITYIGERNMSEFEGYLYPNIVDGAGRVCLMICVILN